jgi:membrane-associated PAP2 superfamily phosphatase
MSADRRWIPELVILVVLAGLATIVFRLTDADMRLSALFYHPGAAGGAWPEGERLPCRVLHHSAPWLASLLGLLGMALLAIDRLRQRRSAWSAHGALILLTLLIGPGLFVNVLSKDYWRRPRPHRTMGLGGQYPYVPPLVIGPHGRSFPCGDAAVGFACGALYYSLRRRRPVAARLCLAGSIAAGLLIGIARMAAGAHFLSDVLWAGFLTWAALLVVHYGMVGIRRTEPLNGPQQD